MEQTLFTLLTKYIAGNGTSLGGVVDAGTFDWSAEDFQNLQSQMKDIKD
jgi:O-acetylhomoserine/O-acetylserine sulfhydrylase-like pyridoxal-dependent enzyme